MQISNRVRTWLRQKALVCALVPCALWVQTKKPPCQEKTPDFDAAAERIIIQQNYKGKLADDERYQAMKKALEEKRKDVLQEIYKAIELALPSNKKVYVYFSDESTGGTWANTETAAQGAKTTFYLPALFKNKQDPVQVFQHEMVHALQRCLMKEDKYERIPHWVREGISVFVAKQGPDRTKLFYDKFKKEFDGDVDKVIAKMVTGLEGTHSKLKYAEDYLAVRYLVEKWGADALKTFVKEITLNSVPYKKSLEKITHVDWKTFAGDAKQYAVAYIKNLESKKDADESK